MGKYDELLVRLDNLIRTHEGKLIDCHDAAAAIRELEAKLEAALVPERTVAGPSIPKRLSSAWSENLCGDGHCEDFVTRKNGIPYQFWTAEQIDAALTEYGAGDIDCCIQNQGERITDLSRQLAELQAERERLKEFAGRRSEQSVQAPSGGQPQETAPAADHKVKE